MSEGTSTGGAYNAPTTRNVLTRAEEDRIIRDNEGLVLTVTKRYRQRPDYEDILQEARTGVLIAARKYDASMARFSTYAALWMRSRVGRYFVNKKRHEPFEVSLSEPESEGNIYTREESLIDEREDVYAKADARVIADAETEQLSDIDSLVVKLYGQGWTYRQIGAYLGRSGQCVGQRIKKIQRQAREREERVEKIRGRIRKGL